MMIRKAIYGLVVLEGSAMCLLGAAFAIVTGMPGSLLASAFGLASALYAWKLLHRTTDVDNVQALAMPFNQAA